MLTSLLLMLCCAPVNVVGTPMPTEGTPMPTMDVATPTPTWADAELYFAEWRTGCELLANVDECQAWANEHSFAFQTEALENIPLGCMQQYPNEVVIFNSFTPDSWSVPNFADVCVSAADEDCSVRMLCAQEDWMVQDDACTTAGQLTEDACQAIGGVSNLYGRVYYTVSSAGLSSGCIVFEESVVWNAHPVGSSVNTNNVCVKDVVPTPMPTTLAPTPTPTWAPGPANAHFAKWREGCQLLLNVDECQAWADTNDAPSFETHDDPNLPRGCMQQYPDKIVIFNSYPMWMPVNLESFCDEDDFTIQRPCSIRMLCREEDWWTGPACDDGTELSMDDCGRMGGVNNLYGMGFGTVNSAQHPAGCFGDATTAATAAVKWNTHPVGDPSFTASMYTLFCSDAPEPCASMKDGKSRNRWCRKKCDKSTKKKSKCNAKCGKKCTSRCNCNQVCVDSTTWFHKDSYDGRVEDGAIPDGSVAGISEGERDWYAMRTCTWVAQDPTERCKVKGEDPAGDTNRRQKAFKACPLACGKCWERRLTSSQVTTLV